MKELWTEKYRPNQLVDYVFRDQAQREQVEGWVKSGAIPHLLFSGSPGVGKTTLARILIHELGIDPFDVMEINASRENNIDTIRAKITGFVQTMPFGDFKIVLLDEADYITPNGQAALRGVMETYSSTARFILTCNYPNRVIPALHSRCQGFHIERVDVTEFTARMATILVTESVEFDLDTLDSYVKATYPDLRKCINLCQMNTLDGRLSAPHGDEVEQLRTICWLLWTCSNVERHVRLEPCCVKTCAVRTWKHCSVGCTTIWICGAPHLNVKTRPS
jgi:replication factor C small subunit